MSNIKKYKAFPHIAKALVRIQRVLLCRFSLGCEQLNGNERFDNLVYITLQESV